MPPSLAGKDDATFEQPVKATPIFFWPSWALWRDANDQSGPPVVEETTDPSSKIALRAKSAQARVEPYPDNPGAEGVIRRKLVEDNQLEAVVGLPAQLFFGTGIPAAIMIFNKGRKSWDKARSKRDKHVLFIDASREFENGKKQNRLRPADIDKIVATYRGFTEVEKYSHLASLEEIQEAEFNLNIPRYVDTFEEEEDIDIPAVQSEIEELEKELAATQGDLNGYLKELGL